MTPRIAQFLRDVTAPVSAALVRGALALGFAFIALAAFLGAIIAGDVALYRWLETIVTPAQALFIIAGSWLVIALLCLVIAWRLTKRGAQVGAPQVQAAPEPPPAFAATASTSSTTHPADIVEPLAKALAELGLQNESVALLAGAQLVRTVKPTQMAAIALVVGYVGARFIFTRNDKPKP